VLAALVIVFVAVTVTMVVLNRPASHGTPRAASTTSSSSSSSASSADLTRLRAATGAANAAITTARTDLHSLTGIPTPAVVQGVMTPYVRSLQHYRTVLAGTVAPTKVRTAAVSARALVTRDVQFLQTLNGLPALELGSYLDRFGKDANQLQKTLGSFQRELRAAHP
jgi:hypothetical protein